MNPGRPLLVGLLAGAVSLGAVPLAHAAFVDQGQASGTFGAATLAPPTEASLSRSCVLGALGVALSARFTASWTPSTTDWAQDQVVSLRNSSGVLVGGPTTLAPGATTVAFDVLTPIGGHTVTVRTRYAGWSSETTAAVASC